MTWVPLRTRDKYREMNKAVNVALDDYWASLGTDENPTPYKQRIEACEAVVLTAFRLLKYIRKEISVLDYQYIDNEELCDTSDAAVSFYSLSDNGAFKEETKVLEILSRSAFKEMKNAKPNEKDMEEIWR